ncbi:hypothetical protein B0T17DRAFT_520572 [Bombardia bombarda]|uniref:Thiaminase-2/PQQC domain-containing protein n=1 Tax=Bombardia bombarda TaxID=252184 RepID=A0AA39XNY5_9PEZI|nr:hypothetical protein B0T17DRAFT_520572 [Bombardia bombarda]
MQQAALNCCNLRSATQARDGDATRHSLRSRQKFPFLTDSFRHFPFIFNHLHSTVTTRNYNLLPCVMPGPTDSSTWSLTEHLLSTFQGEHTTATQHPFLLAAAEGRLPKHILSQWLANDRLYIHSYIRAAGKLLASIDLPPAAPETKQEPGDEAAETQLVDWLIEALVGVRREERFFIDVADRYGLSINFEGQSAATETSQQKPKPGLLPGLMMIQDIFGAIDRVADGLSIPLTVLAESSTPVLLPWLEGAVTFWGTERCYLDAWSWARSKQAVVTTSGGSDDAGTEDADGGALRKEFIPNWSSVEFARFVGRLASLIDFAVAQALERAGDGADAVKDEILKRVEQKWKTLLVAEASFWPDVE